MERIAEAIAKARASRDSGEIAEPLPAARSSVVRTEPENRPTPSEEEGRIADAWSALPETTFRKRLMARHRIVAFAGGPGAAEVDGIRTRLLNLCQAKGWRRVAITSPGPGCGKTTLALNLGFSLARQRDQRAIAIEVDFRRPAFARTLGLSFKHQIARVLEGDAYLRDHAVRHGRNLAIAASHGPVRHPAELLQSSRAAAALDEIQAIYAPTVTLFDLPPMLVNDDAMAFAGRVDCALLVAAAERTTLKELDRCERELASRTNVLGIVLNRCRYMERGDAYGDYKYK